VSDHIRPPAPSAPVAAAARQAELGPHLDSEAQRQSGTSWIGGLMVVAAVLIGLAGGLLALTADLPPVGMVSLLAGAAPVVAGLAVAGARVIRPGPVLHCFEHGVVVEPRPGRGPGQALPWARLLPYEWIVLESAGHNTNRLSVLAVRAADGGREIARFRGPQAVRVAHLLAAAQVPQALDRLARGDRVRCGDLLLSRDSLRLRQLTLAWSEIRDISLHFNEVLVYVHGQPRPVLRVAAGETPHLRTLQAAAARFAARPQDRSTPDP
jgi:hypothetical protein